MMKRLLYGLMVGLATFVLGLWAASVWNTSRPVSLCELDADPEGYAGKTIRFRAGLDLNLKRLTGVAVCRDGETVTAGVRLNPADEASFLQWASLREWEERSRARGGEELKFTVVDAEVVGQFAGPGRGCFGPTYHVTDARVVRAFSIREFGDRGEAVRWFKSNSY